MRSLSWLVLVPLLAGGCSVYSIRRAALTPNPAPVARDGQPLAEPFEVGLGSSSLARASAPTTGSDPNEGIVVPRVDVNGGVRARIGKNFDVGLVFDEGLGAGAEMTAPDMPRPDGDVYGGGLTMHYSLGSGDFRVGLELDTLVYSVPWTESWTCVENCGTDPANMTFVEKGRTDVPVFAFGVIPSYRSGPWTIFGSTTLRNHPTVRKGDVASFELPDPVVAGPVNLVLAAGAEYAFAGNVRLALQAYLPVTSAPAAYGPTLATALVIGLGP